MKILMTADTLGGVWTYAIELIGALAAHGVEVTLATMGRLPDAEQQRQAAPLRNLTLVPSEFKLEWMKDPWRDVEAAKEWLLELEEQVKPDAIHLNNFAQADAAWSAPVAVVAHSCVLSWWKAVHDCDAPAEWNHYRDAVGSGLCAADAVIAPTHAMLNDVRRCYGLDGATSPHSPQLHVIANGRSADLFQRGPKHPFIFAAGRVWDRAKNIKLLNDAAPDLPWRTYVAGPTDHPDGEQPQTFNNMRMLGTLSQREICNWLCECDIFASPSLYEPFGLSILEAALCGCALVLSDIPSLRETWDDAAVFVPARDARAWHEQLRHLIGSPGRRTFLAEAAHQRARIFTPQRMALAYSDLYKNLVRSNAARRHNGFSDCIARHSVVSASRMLSVLAPAALPTNGNGHAKQESKWRERAHTRDPLRMRIVMFYHSLISDWNHGNAHFLRGVVSELKARGHDVIVYEPADGWSFRNLLQHHGRDAISDFHCTFPNLHSAFYDPHKPDLDRMLDGADLVIAHEWNEPEFIKRLSQHHKSRRHEYRLLFHDTHHRAVTAPNEMAKFDLSGFDGALVFGEVLREIYLERGWADSVWTWHEAADIRTYKPVHHDRKSGDVVWIGNWGDEERSAELHEFLIKPVCESGLAAKMHGVRYPDHALQALHKAGIEYGDWLATSHVPQVYARYRATVHIPRRPYVEHLPGIPTIRVFEALACGIPLVCSPWNDAEHLFSPGEDFLIARDGEEMKSHLRRICDEPEFARAHAQHGLDTIIAKHTCAHRVDELMEICDELGMVPAQSAPSVQRESGEVHV